MTWNNDMSAAPRDEMVRVKFHNDEILETYWLEPTPATAAWFPWYLTRKWQAVAWQSITPQEPGNAE